MCSKRFVSLLAVLPCLFFLAAPAETALINIRQIAGGSADQLLGTTGGGGNTEWKTLSGTTNQISISHAAGSITLSTPQDIATSSSPVFNAVGLGTTPASNRKLDIEKGHIRLGQVAAPGAPTVAINVTAGNLNGTFVYGVTFVTALGETDSGTDSASVAPVNQQVDLSNIPTSADSAVTSRKIYRTTAGGATILKKLAITLGDNVTTTATDNTADGSLGANEPRVNSTGGLFYHGSTRSVIIDPSTTAFGFGALQNNVGFANTAYGISALSSNTIGYGNTAVGRISLQNNTTGAQNIAFGGGSLTLNTSGSNNVGVGFDALLDNTIGSENVAAGNYANEDNTAGTNNVSVGYQALQKNTLGTLNTAVGSKALNAVLINSGNVAVGSDALLVFTDAIAVAVGRRALAAATTGPGNVAVGYEAGDLVSIGTYNTLIGTQAGDNITEGGANIVIGAFVDAPSATASQQMTIGNIIFATGVDGTGTTISTGNVGIKIAAPVSGFHVPNNVYAQFENNVAGAPAAADCDNNNERGRLAIDTTNNRLYICNGATRGWDYVALTN